MPPPAFGGSLKRSMSLESWCEGGGKVKHTWVAPPPTPTHFEIGRGAPGHTVWKLGGVLIMIMCFLWSLGSYGSSFITISVMCSESGTF